MPGEKKLIGVYGQLVESGDQHAVVTEFHAAKVKTAVVKGYTLKSDEDRADVFAVKGTEEDSVPVEIYKFGPRGSSRLEAHYEDDGLTPIDVIATGTNADGSTFSDNISIYVDGGTKAETELDKKLDELDSKLQDVEALRQEITDIRDEIANN